MFNFAHITILFLAFGLYGALLLKDDKMSEDDARNAHLELQWHAVGAFVFLTIAYTFYRFIGVRAVPLSLSTAWLLFAGLVHVVGLGRSFFYVGTTAATDKIQQWLARTLHTSVQLLSAVLKILAYVASILYFFYGRFY